MSDEFIDEASIRIIGEIGEEEFEKLFNTDSQSRASGSAIDVGENDFGPGNVYTVDLICKDILFHHDYDITLSTDVSIQAWKWYLVDAHKNTAPKWHIPGPDSTIPQVITSGGTTSNSYNQGGFYSTAQAAGFFSTFWIKVKTNGIYTQYSW